MNLKRKSWMVGVVISLLAMGSMRGFAQPEFGPQVSLSSKDIEQNYPFNIRGVAEQMARHYGLTAVHVSEVKPAREIVQKRLADIPDTHAGGSGKAHYEEIRTGRFELPFSFTTRENKVKYQCRLSFEKPSEIQKTVRVQIETCQVREKAAGIGFRSLASLLWREASKPAPFDIPVHRTLSANVHAANQSERVEKKSVEPAPQFHNPARDWTEQERLMCKRSGACSQMAR